MPDEAAHRSREVRYAPPDADLHSLPAATGDEFVDKLRVLGDMEPGSAQFSAHHLVGSMAPEAIIEQMGPIGPEGFGIIRRTSGVTGVEIDTPRTYLPGGDA